MPNAIPAITDTVGFFPADACAFDTVAPVTGEATCGIALLATGGGSTAGAERGEAA